MIYDTAIIGTGPAGVSAALNLKIHSKNFVWFGTPDLSDKIRKAERVQNYPGLSDVCGEEMSEIFKKQISDMNIEIKDAMINSVMPMGEYYALMAGSDFYEAKTVIFATGVAPASTIAGESEFLGRGVSYCATCDGNLYKGKQIAVICNNRRFEHEVKFLSELAAKVYFFPQYKGFSNIGENAETVLSKIERIEGEKRVNKIKLKEREIELDGVFCLRDLISPSVLLSGLEIAAGHITVDRKMATNFEGIFAAGDCVGRPYQYAKAVGEGNIAAHSVIEYLSKLERKERNL